MAYRSILILFCIFSCRIWGLSTPLVNGEKLSSEDVKRITRKDTAPTKTDIETAIYFKLAVAAAKSAGLQDQPETKALIERALYEAYLKKESKAHAKSLEVSESELKNYYSKFPERRTYHLMLNKVEKPGSASVSERIQKIQSALNSGTPFKKLVQEFSEDETALSGGDLDFRGKNALPNTLYETVLSLKKNTPSKPVYLENTVHIVQWTDERGYKETPATYLAFLKGELQRTKELEMLKSSLEKLKHAAKIEYPKGEAE